MSVDLDDRDSTVDGFMIGPIPDEFRDLICTGTHRAGWTRHPKDVEENNEKDRYIWVCGECLLPSRVALVNCVGCEIWFYELDSALIINRQEGFNPRGNYFCEGCR